jgi:hypothetical protein
MLHTERNFSVHRFHAANSIIIFKTATISRRYFTGLIRITHSLIQSINQSINQSVNRYLLTCRLNSKSAYYKASTKTQIQHKNRTDTHNNNNNNNNNNNRQ